MPIDPTPSLADRLAQAMATLTALSLDMPAPQTEKIQYESYIRGRVEALVLRLLQEAEHLRQELIAEREKHDEDAYEQMMDAKDAAEAQVARLTAENAAQQVQLTARRVHQARLPGEEVQ